jgi:hypothetical protein
MRGFTIVLGAALHASMLLLCLPWMSAIQAGLKLELRDVLGRVKLLQCVMCRGCNPQVQPLIQTRCDE